MRTRVVRMFIGRCMGQVSSSWSLHVLAEWDRQIVIILGSLWDGSASSGKIEGIWTKQTGFSPEKTHRKGFHFCAIICTCLPPRHCLEARLKTCLLSHRWRSSPWYFVTERRFGGVVSNDRQLYGVKNISILIWNQGRDDKLQDTIYARNTSLLLIGWFLEASPRSLLSTTWNAVVIVWLQPPAVKMQLLRSTLKSLPPCSSC